MDVLTDDHEREEVVKKWWHEDWKPIALGVVIALGGLIGFRQYQLLPFISCRNSLMKKGLMLLRMLRNL